MKRTFLYKLFKSSKPWFIFCVLFIFLYFFFVTKKMDSVFTPYNGMFAFVNTKPYKTSTIAVKLDNRLMRYTKNLWWKKDFFENSIAFYSRYIVNYKQVPLNDYIKQKPFSIGQKEFLYKRLLPDSIDVKLFPGWLIHYAGESASENSILEFVKYEFSFLNNKLILTDSTTLFKIKVSNGDQIY